MKAPRTRQQPGNREPFKIEFNNESIALGLHQQPLDLAYNQRAKRRNLTTFKDSGNRAPSAAIERPAFLIPILSVAVLTPPAFGPREANQPMASRFDDASVPSDHWNEFDEIGDDDLDWSRGA
jgi:hypothetical protein